MALLTPKDIREHIFQTVRFKEGYDVDEVDDFLDQVTETVEALGQKAVQGGASTQSLSPDVTSLNTKISDLTAQLEASQNENRKLKEQQSASENSASQTGSRELNEAQQQVQALTQQNDQLKQQVDQLNSQIDQLTAQAAKGDNTQALNDQLVAVGKERDQFKTKGEELAQQLGQSKQQLFQIQQSARDFATKNDTLSRQLDESKQREEQLRQQVSKMEPSTETGSLKKIAGAGADANSEPERATAMLTLAMQLHDQYVDKGKAKGAELIADGQSKHDDLVAKGDSYMNRTHADADNYSKRVHDEADGYSDRVRSEADAYSGKSRQDADTYSKNKRAEADTYEVEVHQKAQAYDRNTRSTADQYAADVKEKLVAQSKVIEGNIQGLKQFETEYRSRLKSFLGQLVSQVSNTDSFDGIGSDKGEDK
ncbi:DivIVA domain-containing protein [Bifidobacterium aquikefiri]|uniref:DivIVA domain-containing protein n=1 Tax=Bifidobacterium aquikefiri TaxID=1653207 RepID=UPI0023EFED15|nr:DivIVA domain-containing protein [Bifidobacterium aquikefiri]